MLLISVSVIVNLIWMELVLNEFFLNSASNVIFAGLTPWWQEQHL